MYDNTKDYIKTAKNRYYCISKEYAKDGQETFENNALLVYHTTTDNFNYHIVEIDKDDEKSDDISSLLEWAFHDIKDRTMENRFDDTIYILMGAVKYEELDETLNEYDEYTTLDCGYVIPGLIDYAKVIDHTTIAALII